MDSSRLHQECRACGLHLAVFTEELNTPFHSQPFDFSPGACQMASRVVEEGSQRVRDLNQAIEKLSAIRDRMSQVVKQHRNFLTAMNRLPDDVLLDILDHATGRHGTEWGDAPWDFSIVCRRWRRLTLSHDRLWTSIRLGVKNSDTAVGIRRNCRRAELQLRRSGSCALNVQMDFIARPSSMSRPNDVTDSILERTVRDLLASSSRCRALTLRGRLPTEWDVHPSYPLVYSQLENLTITSNIWIIKPFLLSAPALVTVSLASQDMQNMGPVWSASLSQISIQGCIGTTTSFLAALQCTKRLRILSMGGLHVSTRVAEDISDSVPLQSVNLPELRELSLSFLADSINDPPPMLSLIRHITAPSLLALQIHELSAHSDPEVLHRQWNAVEEFLLTASSVGSSLRQLRLKRCMLDAVTRAIPLLLKLPDLEELSIEGRGREENVTALLVALRSEFPLCPQLKRLVIKEASVQEEDLENTVRSRLNVQTTADDPGRPSQGFLEHVYVQDVVFRFTQRNKPAAPDPHKCQWFEDLKRLGLLDSESHMGYYIP